jgi:copper(I)-binding protein
MSHLSRRNLLAAAALAALVPFAAPVGAQEHPPSLHVHNAYARINPAVKSGAVFFLIHNGTDQDVTLIGVETAIAAVAEMHTHIAGSDGMMQMKRIEGGVSLPQDQSHEFARGGDHVMLMGLSTLPAEGETFELTLFVDGAEPLTFDVVVDNARLPMADTALGAPQPSN